MYKLNLLLYIENFSHSKTQWDETSIIWRIFVLFCNSTCRVVRLNIYNVKINRCLVLSRLSRLSKFVQVLSTVLQGYVGNDKPEAEHNPWHRRYHTREAAFSRSHCHRFLVVIGLLIGVRAYPDAILKSHRLIGARLQLAWVLWNKNDVFFFLNR